MLQIKLYTIPVTKTEDADEMNKFLRSVKVLETIQQIVAGPNGSYWCFCIKYYEGGMALQTTREKVDYKDVLPPDKFTIFSKLREWRREASKSSNLPAYAIFTDEELSKIALLDAITPAEIKSIKGIGEKKVELYAPAIVQVINDIADAR
ncbi:MAG: HRDC domain-containing protein [Saprospiraceae bacterium]|nr:HRDC domain-containing protein [Saprospiraceae bacterium]